MKPAERVTTLDIVRELKPEPRNEGRATKDVEWCLSALKPHLATAHNAPRPSDVKATLDRVKKSASELERALRTIDFPSMNVLRENGAKFLDSPPLPPTDFEGQYDDPLVEGIGPRHAALIDQLHTLSKAAAAALAAQQGDQGGGRPLHMGGSAEDNAVTWAHWLLEKNALPNPTTGSYSKERVRTIAALLFEAAGGTPEGEPDRPLKAATERHFARVSATATRR